MALEVKVPIRTAVIEQNPDCKISGGYKNGELLISIDTRYQNHHKRLGISNRTPIKWGKQRQYEAQELSALSWPIRYRVWVREGYYMKAGKRVYFTTQATGLDSRRGVSEVLMRAAVLLLVIAGMGYRRVSWLLEILFHVSVSRSSLQRWVGEVASHLPSADEIIEHLNEQAPITEGHLDEIFPRGMNHCVLVLKDEHGRILGTEATERRDETSAKDFLMRFKRLGISFGAFYTDGYKPYYNAIRAVFGEHIPIQYDYFHIIQNVWRHLRQGMVGHRRKMKKRAENATTPWYKEKLQAMAKELWEQRFLLFKAEKKMNQQEREILLRMMQEDPKVNRLRGFIDGVWNIFENSQNEDQARKALEDLKRQLPSKDVPKSFTRVVNFLDRHFTWMTAFLRHEHVKRNSLAESGMRVLRRLEVEHDGFRSDNGRENFLRIYQAIKYLGWSVYDPPNLSRRICVG